MVLSTAGAINSGGQVTLTLPPPGNNVSLKALASNVGSIFNNGRPRYGDSVVAATDPVRVIFNQPVDPATLVVTLVDDTGASVATASSVKQGNVVEVSPKTSLTPGGAYYVTLEARAAGLGAGGYRASLAGWFYVPAGNTAPVVASVVFKDVNSDGFLDAGDEADVVFDRAVGGDLGVGESVYFYINADLDGSGPIGDAPFEAGSGTPINLMPMPPPVGPFPGLVRTYRLTLPFVAPVGTATPYQFGPNTKFAYVIDFPGSPRVPRPRGPPAPDGRRPVHRDLLGGGLTRARCPSGPSTGGAASA